MIISLVNILKCSSAQAVRLEGGGINISVALLINIQSDTSKASPQYFPRKPQNLSSHEYFLVLFMKIDIVVTIYSKFRFDYHKGKQPGMVNAHLPPKNPYSLAHYGIFKFVWVLHLGLVLLFCTLCLLVLQSY